jgi:YjbE family integral membrane protein
MIDFLNAHAGTWAGPLTALFTVLLIDLTLAGDNAVAVGMAAAGLPPKQRRQAIIYGLAGAVVLLIGFAMVAVQLLKIIGLLLAGGVLLLWVCWKMWRDMHEPANVDAEGVAVAAPTKTLRQALIQILVADVSMSLDNVLAVAGAARQYPWVLLIGLVMSVTLMGLAAHAIAKLLHRWRWLGYLGLVFVLVIAVRMIWEGHREVVVRMDETAVYNQYMPDIGDITPQERNAFEKK